MKKTIFLLSTAIMLAISINTNAQGNWYGTTVPTLTTGNVAIKGGQIDFTGPHPYSIIIGGDPTGSLGILSGNYGGLGADGAYLQLFGKTSTGKGSLNIVSSGDPSDPVTYAENGIAFISQPTGSPGIYNMVVRNDGKVVIGANIISPWNVPDGYNLYVSNGILTEKLKVALNSDPANWSDFVFKKGYKLMPLKKVESYIKSNNHLPEVPSAQEVSENGIDVATMDAKLLQKIEELTLYVIQQQKEIDALKKRN